MNERLHQAQQTKNYEHNFLKLLDNITDGSSIVVNETGTVVKYRPGLLIGGKLQHDCGIERSIGYFLEALICLAPFCKKPLEITLKGVTNDGMDPLKNSGKSPGFGLILMAESTTGVFYSAEAISKPSGSGEDFVVPEDVAKQACYKLFEEINRGGCIESFNQSLACLMMALGPADVSKIKTGPLSPYTHIEDFLQLRMKLETEKDEDLQTGTHKVIMTCVGIGFSNLSRSVK
ncbi:RNA 3'-terminal phosphate cyclase-like protein [Caerostris extrusa]|uniref:RNA 3'-terminal phosphate cyclase-like protein n=1 Tax=Caerostris extrusa TaxID=172846 RepID=A0AAV4VNU1_CAEEX|nr:RNA 3'-terminal phosphate cyclase-like protein [Caerostris extrusa]